VQWELCCVLIFWFFCHQSCPDYFGGKSTKKKKGSKEIWVVLI
jgi:hypothetical protein